VTQILGWLATAVFVGSYFFSRPAALRAMQMAGALLWIVYGVLIDALPVIAANVLVFSAAAWTAFGRRALNQPGRTA
jgi:Trk-type K+ transport system membrane component